MRVCFVEGRGTYKKAPRFCPILEQTSNIECVIGLDRLDCLRRIGKGTAHFGVFSSEDMVAANLAGVDVLVTSEMRFNDGKTFAFALPFGRITLCFGISYKQIHFNTK